MTTFLMRFSLLIILGLHAKNTATPILLNQEPSFEAPVCQVSTQSQFHSPDYHFWLKELHEQFRYHRKPWEFCYIAQVLYLHGALQPGRRGIGFGTGDEPLPALFAKYGCHVVASDQDYSCAVAQGWVKAGQNEWQKEMLNSKGICDPELFNQRVELRSIDMKNIDNSLWGQFDFVWSSCALEHLGSLRAGLNFIKKSLKCLKPGGIAVHTTEYNLSSHLDTLYRGGTVLYRQRDIIKLATDLISMGYEVATLNFHPGDEDLDRYIDLPPYTEEKHLKLRIEKYVTTSLGIVIRKPEH
ncbi:MAG TPA: methyltransferase domain-containing protein [Rhabdochlamydiaceae bacterium]|jgi:SAM-dependent methyltransferase